MLETLLALLPVALPASAQAPDTSEASRAESPDAAALFVKNCAACHGERGDGDGPTKLDRPARSFRDGGFSYGNTPDALFRTITYGIPGTPMPSFESSLTEVERDALAAYVVSLGPPVEVVAVEDTVLAVGARPAIVRGYLPPIAEGAPERPRGLLIGRPEGTTFEYRIDDVRLLGLRHGGFVERRDWNGRGGTALAPLGAVVQLVEGGDPLPPFRALDARAPLTARLSGSWIEGGAAGLDYRLVQEGATLARVREAPRPLGTSIGAGYARAFRVTAERDVELALRIHAYGAAQRVDAFRARAASAAGGEPADADWTVFRAPAGGFTLVGIAPAGAGGGEQPPGVVEVALSVRAGAEARVDAHVLAAHAWDDATRARFVAEIGR